MYLEAITAYGYSKDTDKVISTWKDYTQHYKLKSSSHHRYISALIQCEDLQTAQQILRDLKTKNYVKHEEISRCLADFVTACMDKNHAYLALKSTGEFLGYAKSWDTASIQHIAAALWRIYCFYLPIPSKMDTLAFDKFVDLYTEKLTGPYRAKSKHHFMPLHLFTMFRLFTIIQTSTPSIHSCNQIIESQVVRGDYSAIKYILSYMQKHSIQPTTRTVSLLLKSLGSSLPINEVQLLYNNLKESNRLDIHIYQAFVKLFSEKSNKLYTQLVISDMEKQGLKIEENLCTTVVEGYVNQGDLSQATKWLEKNHEIAVKNLDSYAVLMEACISRGEWDACMKNYASLVSKKVKKINTNRRIVKALLTARFASGKYWDLCRTQLRTLDISFTPTTIFRILRSLIGIEKNGNHLVSGKAIVKALQIMETELDIHLNAEGIGRVIVALGKRGDCHCSYEIYKWVREDKSASNIRCASSNIYSATMHSALLNNDFRILDRAWVDMQYRKRFVEYENGTKAEKLEHTLARYNVLLNGYASVIPKPDITRLKRVYQKLLKQQLSPDITTYNILIKAFVNGNNMSAANQVYQTMVDSGIKPDTITANTILNGWILRKDWAKVEDFIQSLKSNDTSEQKSSMDIVTFNLLVQSFLRLDSKTMAFARLLKSENKWHDSREIEKGRVVLPSKKIWSIFETTTGYCKETLDNFCNNSIVHSEVFVNESLPVDFNTICDGLKTSFDNFESYIEEKTIKDTFIRFFSKSTEPDLVTYKLFMKAFVDTNDYGSASKIKKWMYFRLPHLKQ
ncbi:hypothetical protein BY458DRAFT_434837 [Sporodiniella umbellata]|nr:hypothetical protein BY458DRAFT_434837 [Sporodiniella umbellata]